MTVFFLWWITSYYGDNDSMKNYFDWGKTDLWGFIAFPRHHEDTRNHRKWLRRLHVAPDHESWMDIRPHEGPLTNAWPRATCKSTVPPSVFPSKSDHGWPLPQLLYKILPRKQPGLNLRGTLESYAVKIWRKKSQYWGRIGRLGGFLWKPGWFFHHFQCFLMSNFIQTGVIWNFTTVLVKKSGFESTDPHFTVI